jgi:uncharacterized protein (TIGR02145 family)
MKTKHFLVLSLILATAISALQAQVRIGDLSAPRTGVSLDLNGKDNTAKTGLGLPVVTLTDPQSALPLASSFDNLKGVIVYNVGTENDLTEGPYIASTNGWVSFRMGGDVSEDADIILLEPLPATVWLGGNGSTLRQVTVTTSIDNDPGVNLTYRWYYLVKDGNGVWGNPLPTDSIQKTFTVTQGNGDFQLASAGVVKRYFCAVRNGSKSAVTTRFRAVYGNGVFLNNDQWLNMLTYNLGVSDPGKSLTPAQQYGKTSDDATVAGYLYQWGRKADGHQFRDTTVADAKHPFLYYDVSNVSDGLSDLDVAGQVASTHPAYGKFILRNGGVNDWRSIADNSGEWLTDDPCRSVNDGSKTWRLPTSDEWVQINVNNNPENTGKGLRFKPDGTSVSIFLPASGFRYRDGGGLANVGSAGYYWSRSQNNTSALFFYFSTTETTPAYAVYRSAGISVRCVAE